MNRVQLGLKFAAAGLLVASTLGAALAQVPAAPAGRKVFNDSVTPITVSEGLEPRGLIVRQADPRHKDEVMDVLFSLEIPAASLEKLEELVAKGEVLPAKTLVADYSPKAADADKLVAWLKSEGFEITKISADHTSIYTKAKVSRIAKTLQVDMARVTKNGLTYTAARNAPSLPNDIGANVGAIIGLQPFRRAHKQSRFRPSSNGNRFSEKTSATALQSTAAAAPVANSSNTPPYLVGEILGAYGANGLGVTGHGEKIAILIDTFPNDNDLKAFWKVNSPSVTLGNVEKVNVSGGVLPPQEGEETLDVEWATGIAPGATVRVYASGSLSFVDLDKALDMILTDLQNETKIHQLSISLGLGETYMGGPKGEVATQHQKFLKLAAAGVNVFVSSGDAGSNPDETGHNSSGPLQVEYESSDSCVIGVGGTSLLLDTSSGTVADETAWPGSGGGQSIFFKRPIWQKGPGVPSGHKRLVPDLSLTADPDRGAYLFFQGSVQQIGGTSWSAPAMAGLCALINEARAKAGKPNLPFLGPIIYPLMSTNCFRDITAGNNGQYSAGPGYDRVTGIGVPNVIALIVPLTM